MTNEKLYAVRISKSNKEYIADRYISDTNFECWKETSQIPSYIFTKSQIDEFKKKLPKMFVYYAAFIDEDGNEEQWSAFKETNKVKVVETKQTDEFDFSL